MGTPSPELKQLWIRVLKRVHPDLAIDEQDRIRCERLTKLANEAYQAGDLEALRAVLSPSQPPDATASRSLSSWFLFSNIPPMRAFSSKQFVALAIAVVILLWRGFSVFSLTTSRHAVTNSPTTQADRVRAPIPAHVQVPDADFWKSLPFETSAEPSAAKVSLFTAGAHSSLASPCLNSVPQLGTFVPSEWGNKGSLNVDDDCAHPSQQAPPQTSPPVASSIEPSPLYMKQMRERLYQTFRTYEFVDANVPPGNSAEMWFDVNRNGSLSHVRVGKPSGWNSLDYACMRAVQRTETVGALPEDYKLRALPATFACTYTGSNALRTSRSADSAGGRPDLYVGSVRETAHE